MTHYTLLNGVEQHAKYPDTFEIPDDEEKNALVPGDFVKLCFDNKERMWVEVVGVGLHNLTGTLANTPVYVEGVEYGDYVIFEKDHIIGIVKPEEEG